DIDLSMLKALGLSITGAVQLKVGFDWNLSFGVSKSDGVFLATNATSDPELKVFVEATTPGLSAVGNLGFLRVEAKDNPASPTRLAGAFTVNFTDGDGRLTPGDLSSGRSLVTADSGFGGTANVNFDLLATFGGNVNFPYVQTGFGLRWG